MGCAHREVGEGLRRIRSHVRPRDLCNRGRRCAGTHVAGHPGRRRRSRCRLCGRACLVHEQRHGWGKLHDKECSRRGWAAHGLGDRHPPGERDLGYPDLHGQELVFGTPRDGLQAVKLLPNGRFGARSAFVTGAPPPAYSTGSSVIQLRDRVVQLVDACDYVEAPARPCREFEIRLGACCDVSDKAVNYASFVKRGFEPPLLGLDRKGRLGSPGRAHA